MSTMDTNTTLAHLAAQIAELRDQMTTAELDAIHWRDKFHNLQHSIEHLQQANQEYAEAVTQMQEEIDRLRSGELDE